MPKKLFSNPYLLAVLSGVLLRLSFPKPGLWGLAWVALVPLFFALEGKKPRKAFLLSYLCGVVFFLTTVFWLIHVTVPGMVVLSLYLALFVAAFGVVYAFYKERMTFWQGAIFVAAFWVFLEFCRSNFFTGFPWALLGYGQAPNLWGIQAADMLGAFGVSFFVVFTNVLVFEFLKLIGRKQRIPIARLGVALALVFLWFAYGALRVAEDPKKSCFFKVAVIQGNIDNEIKWATTFSDKIFKKHQLLTEIADLKAEPDLVVWPETSYPDYIGDGSDINRLKVLARNTATPLLVGSVMLRQDRYFNSALLFSSDGELAGTYDKIHLVPFGEFIPARKVFPFLASIVPVEDFTPGKEFTLFTLEGKGCSGLRLATLVCFEDLFAGLSRRFVQKGADILVNVTNDSWFGDTSSPYQHMQASVLRAVENRVYVIRAANTGISCFIDDKGKAYATVRDARGKPTFVTGYQVRYVAKTGRGGLYTKIGDVFAFICIFYVMIMMIRGSKSRK